MRGPRAGLLQSAVPGAGAREGQALARAEGTEDLGQRIRRSLSVGEAGPIIATGLRPGRSGGTGIALASRSQSRSHWRGNFFAFGAVRPGDDQRPLSLDPRPARPRPHAPALSSSAPGRPGRPARGLRHGPAAPSTVPGHSPRYPFVLRRLFALKAVRRSATPALCVGPPGGSGSSCTLWRVEIPSRVMGAGSGVPKLEPDGGVDPRHLLHRGHAGRPRRKPLECSPRPAGRGTLVVLIARSPHRGAAGAAVSTEWVAESGAPSRAPVPSARPSLLPAEARVGHSTCRAQASSVAMTTLSGLIAARPGSASQALASG